MAGRPCIRSAPISLAATIFFALMYGARISMTIGIFTVITSGLIGITLGVVGGYLADASMTW